MSAYLTYKLWKLALVGLAAFVYGFIRAGRKRRKGSRRFEEED